MQKIRDLLVWSILLFTVCQAVIDLDVKKSFRKADIEDDPYVSLTVSNNN